MFLFFEAHLGRFFSRDAFRYYPLVSGGGRGPRTEVPTSLSSSHVFVGLSVLLFSSMASFFVGRMSITDQDHAVVHRELDLPDSTTAVIP